MRESGVSATPTAGEAIHIFAHEEKNDASQSRLCRQETVTPFWNSQTAELWLGDRLIKQFRQPAQLQRLILSCFQEDDWTRRIDDPLPPGVGRDGVPMDSKRRLRDLVSSLNANHVTSGLLRFRSDGTGEGIVWSWLNSSHVNSAASLC